MKKLFLLVAAFALTFSLAACSTEDLDSQIADLETQVSDLNTEVTELEAENEALEALLPGTGDYTPGTYFSYDETDGSSALVVVNENGFIVSVFFDQLRIKTAINEETGEVVFTTFSTKQALQEDYTLASGYTWAEEADELAAAIVANQGWNTDWAIIDEGGSLSFDLEDQDVIDDVSGVTITITGFKTTFDDAISQAE